MSDTSAPIVPLEHPSTQHSLISTTSVISGPAVPGAVLIIGAGSDIAQAIARTYAEAKRPLILAARNPERLDRTAEDLRAASQYHRANRRF